MTSLKEIKKISESGCIEKPSRVAKALDGIANLRMGEVFMCDNKDLRELYESLVLMHGLEAGVLDQLAYAELIGLIEAICMVMEMTDPTDCESISRMYVHFLKRVLLKAEKTHSTVKCFLAVKIGAMLDDMTGRVINYKAVVDHEKDMQRDYSEIIPNNEKAAGFRDRTVGNVLRLTTEVCSKSWSSWMSIDDYKKSILCACNLDRVLLVMLFFDSFHSQAYYRTVVFNHYNYVYELPDWTMEENFWRFDEDFVTEI